jgi:hypothetical protein
MITNPATISSSLFFRIAATQPDGADWARPDEEHTVNWKQLIAIALLENSVTLLNERIATLPPSSVPEGVRTQVGRLALVWTFKLRLLQSRLEDSLAALASAGIDVTLLKGAALALTVYPNFVDRPMADVDLLVHPERATQAHEILRKSGWSVETGSLPVDTWSDHHHLSPLSDESGSGLRLELHIAPLVPGHPFRLTRKDVVASARGIDVNGIKVLVPERHLHAVHAAIHFAYSHQFLSGGLNAFRDIATLSDSGEWSWNEFVATARRTGSESCCYWTLRLARGLTGLPVPTDVLDAISPVLGDRVSSVLEEHFSQLVLRAEHACPSVELRRRLWEYALHIEGLGNSTSQFFEVRPDPNQAYREASLFRKISVNIRRAPKWSRYVASLLGPSIA